MITLPGLHALLSLHYVPLFLARLLDALLSGIDRSLLARYFGHLFACLLV